MRALGSKFGAVGLVAMLVAAGCASPERHTRQQAPLYELNDEVAVALVQISEMDGVSAGEGGPEVIWDALQGALEGTQMTLVDRRGGPEVVAFSANEDDRRVAAELAEVLPVEVEEPLVLAVAVAGWEVRTADPTAGQNREEVRADLVYALLASDGEALEVRRVQTTVVPRSGRYDAVEVFPGWPRWLHESWEQQHPTRAQSLEREEARAYGIRLSARAFAHAFAWHQVDYEVLLYDEGDLAAGVQLLQQGDRQGATQHFEQLVEGDPQNASALFNLGVMLELEGLDRRALEILQQSYALDPRGRTMRHIEAIERRLELRTDLRTTIESSRETRTSQREQLLQTEERRDEPPQASDEDAEEVEDLQE